MTAYRLKFAAAAALALRQRVGQAAGNLRGGTAVRARRALGALRRQRDRCRAGVHDGLAALARHRHGTWLLLFCALFTLLWLLAGWAGMANGIWRSLLVGIATPIAVSALFPLRPAALRPIGSR